MCTDGHMSPSRPVLSCVASAWDGEVIWVGPVDAVSVLVVCDISVEFLLVDEGPAHRMPIDPSWTRFLDAPTLEEGRAPDAPLAHHGFSTLVTIDVGTSVDFVAGPLDVVGGEPVAMAATS